MEASGLGVCCCVDVSPGASAFCYRGLMAYLPSPISGAAEEEMADQGGRESFLRWCKERLERREGRKCDTRRIDSLCLTEFREKGVAEFCVNLPSWPLMSDG